MKSDTTTVQIDRTTKGEIEKVIAQRKIDTGDTIYAGDVIKDALDLRKKFLALADELMEYPEPEDDYDKEYASACIGIARRIRETAGES